MSISVNAEKAFDNVYVCNTMEYYSGIKKNEILPFART